MGFFNRTHKKFEYTPRYYKGEGNPYKIEHKFDEFRTTVGKKNLKAKFSQAVEETKNSKGINKTILITIAILVFIFLYIIDFDLSIFQLK
ncbi:riboflavin synthase subunit beta [Aureibaculum marinum]|uniref:Riboflavin synthase subunit beta n=1 Tax=Aureibaculum marinum TaxID=2487930 RepID=A0A3N4NWV3_9FLAO|nr:riboflavin synthase subunit beta [Aureibaculum marinum]RPE00852.1 riboflavin synthase subunit beta [Aureibaculum marinum]